MAIDSAGAAAAAIEGTGGGFNITPPFSGTLPAALDGGSITTHQDVNISDPYFVTGNSPSLTTTGRIVSSEFVADDGNHAATFTAAGLQDSGTYGFAGNLVLTGNSTTVAAGDTLEAASLTLAPGASLRDDSLIQAGNAPNPFTLSVTGNAALSGIGQVNGTLSNASGVVQPGDPGATGTLSVTMNYAQGAGGALAIPVGASAQSKLQVAGAVTLAGNLLLEPTPAAVNGLAPGTMFPAVAFGAPAASGACSLLEWSPSLHAGEGFQYASPSNAGEIDVVAVGLPVNTVAPAISGSAAAGSTLTASNGTWSSFTQSYAYQWQDCPTKALTGCVNIAGANSSTYKVDASDACSCLTVVVTAIDGAGQASATATPVGPVPAAHGGGSGAGGSGGSGSSGGSGGSGHSGHGHASHRRRHRRRHHR